MNIRHWLLAGLSLLPLAATADDLRVAQLEQEVRRLERNVQSLSRRLDDLQRPSFDPPRAAAPASSPPTSSDWLDAAKWRQVKTGMSELEVISLLGAPTSMREENGARVLLYALEVGTAGFLGGSVKTRAQKVFEVETPTLK
jgi:hypothetical protein